MFRAAPLVFMLACQDYDITETVDVVDPTPAILVDPEVLAFPLTDVGSTSIASVRIENAGTATLSILSTSVEGSLAFDLLQYPPTELLPGEFSFVQVEYSPVNPADDALLAFLTNDPSSPTTDVSLTGLGAYPELTVTPEPYDFGELPQRCRREQTFMLENTGLVALDIESFAHVGEGFDLTAPPVPATLAPGEALLVTIGFSGVEEGAYDGSLVVESNAPGGQESANQTAVVVPTPTYDETFREPQEYTGADVIFWVDGSGSMYDDRSNLSTNFQQFTNRLAEYTADYRVHIVGDNGCMSATISPETVDLKAVFEQGVKASHGWEAGLAVGLSAVQQSGTSECNDGMLRPGSKTLIIVVSDEAEQSGQRWNDLVDGILAIAPTTTISAAAGDVPAGCATAVAGFGYYEAATATKGAFLSICTTDWGSQLQALASTVDEGNPTNTFELAAVPDPETLQVTVDDVPSWAWVYDEVVNAVVFAIDAMPAPGAHVRVRYQGVPECVG